MSVKDLAAMIGQTITLYDKRTDARYDQPVVDVRTNFGKVQIKVYNTCRDWFEPTSAELSTLSNTSK